MVLALVRTAYTLLGLWHCFGWTLAKGIWEEAGLQENVGVGHVLPAKSMGAGGYYKWAPIATFKNCQGWYVTRCGCTDELNGGAHGISKLDADCWNWAGKGSEMVPACSFVFGEVYQRSLTLQHMLWDR